MRWLARVTGTLALPERSFDTESCMAQDSLLPLFIITNGPNWDHLSRDLKGIDYSVESPIFFKVTGIPSGMYVGVDMLSKPNSGGMCTVTGVWLNSGSESDELMKVTLQYSPRTRKGIVMSITR